MPSISDYENGLYEAMNEETVQGYGTITAPTADNVVCNVVLPDPGVWEITVYARLGSGGTPAAADNDNVYLRNNTTVVTLLSRIPLIATQNSVPVPITIRHITTTVNNSIVVRAVGAGSASVVYSAVIVARKVSDELS